MVDRPSPGINEFKLEAYVKGTDCSPYGDDEPRTINGVSVCDDYGMIVSGTPTGPEGSDESTSMEPGKIATFQVDASYTKQIAEDEYSAFKDTLTSQIDYWVVTADHLNNDEDIDAPCTQTTFGTPVVIGVFDVNAGDSGESLPPSAWTQDQDGTTYCTF